MIRSHLAGAQLLAALLLAVAPLAAQNTAPAPHHLVQVSIRDAATLDRLLALDLDLAACTKLELPVRVVDVIASDDEIAKLRAAGLEFEVAIRNLEDHHERELASFGAMPLTLTPPVGQGGMGGHYTLAQMEAILDSFAKDHPQLCTKKVSIGKTVEGRDIWMVKISDNVLQDENEPEVHYDAVHHAREPLSMTTTLLFMDRLLTGYGKDPDLTWLVNNREMFFVPCVNPDGYEYNRSIRPGGGGMWRKNRRRNSNGSYGVDINRNYTTGWSAPYGGNSTNPNSETYRGTAPLSEPEAQAVDAFMKARNAVHVCSCHTYTDVLLRPWGYQRGNPTNESDYQSLGKWLTKVNQVNHGTASGLLYIAAGTTLDQAHAVHGAYGWTPELGKSSEGGFWPNPTNQVAIANRHQDMFEGFAQTAGAWLEKVSVTLREGANSDRDGRIEPGEDGEIVVRVQNQGSAATTTPVVLQLTASSSDATVTVGSINKGTLAAFAATDNASTPLKFRVAAQPKGPVVQLTLEVRAEGRPLADTITVPLAPMRVAVDDDMESDRGHARGPSDTATTGRFERAVPSQTSSGSLIVQPGSDHSPAGVRCWITEARAGSSAGSYDIDNGFTEVWTPTLDLRHLAAGQLRFWYWWVDSTNSDRLELSVSLDDGKSWSSLWSTGTNTSAWRQQTVELPTGLTDTVRFKWRGADFNASLAEAGVDDIEILGISGDAGLTLLTSGRIGSTARYGITGSPGAKAQLLVSTGTAKITVPGIDGDLLLDPSKLVVLPPVTLPASGAFAFDVTIPTNPGLVGLVLHGQALQAAGSSLRLGNRQTLTVR